MSLSVLPRRSLASRLQPLGRITAPLAAVAVVLLALAPGSSQSQLAGASSVVPQRVAAGHAAKPDSARPHGKKDDPARGLVWAGLHDSATGPCDGDAYVVRAVGKFDGCTHGPDATPRGVDARKLPSTASLEKAAERVASGTTGTTGTAAGTATSVPCYGDGSSGNRVQAIYAVAADKSDRYSSVASLIRTYAANVDNVYSSSAAQTGQVRHVRWVTDSTCQLTVSHAVLSSTGDDSFGNMKAELASLGFTRSDRKYVVWMDAAVYCGIANVDQDDQPGQANTNNHGPTFARIDAACWGASTPVEAHELTHMLGGVQLTAPHSNGAWHCFDEYDRMCYDDGSGVAMQFVCASSQEPLLDCNHDDYFYAGTPPTGNYLATHWNVANSSFLEIVDPSSSPVATTASPTPTTVSPTPTTASPVPTTTSPVPTTTSAPAPTANPVPTTASPTPTSATTVLSGSLNRKTTSKTFTMNVGSGGMSAALSFSKVASLGLTVRNSAGAVVATGSGPSVLRVASTVPAGSYTLTVAGSGNTSFTLTVTHA